MRPAMCRVCIHVLILIPKKSLKKNNTNSKLFSVFVLFPCGGEEGIRTLGTFLYTAFRVYASIVYLPSYSPAQYRKNQGYTRASRTK